jgi:hypothetical protein
METVFDHNITDKEWENICGVDKKLYLEILDDDHANRDVALLYFLRGDTKKVKHYANKIKDNLTRIDFWRLVGHP